MLQPSYPSAPELHTVLLTRTVFACLLLVLDCMKFSNNAE